MYVARRYEADSQGGPPHASRTQNAARRGWAGEVGGVVVWWCGGVVVWWCGVASASVHSSLMWEEQTSDLRRCAHARYTYRSLLDAGFILDVP